MDSARHDADFYERHSRYFNLLRSRIEEHEVEAENTYNTDEKGFGCVPYTSPMRFFGPIWHASVMEMVDGGAFPMMRPWHHQR